ncbi:MAG: hypothetical protein ACI4QT_04105 [Kiritimatiellia bacterium]
MNHSRRKPDSDIPAAFNLAVAFDNASLVLYNGGPFLLWIIHQDGETAVIGCVSAKGYFWNSVMNVSPML